MTRFPVGKLPQDILDELLQEYGPTDPRVVLGPGVGVDCAALDFGETLLVAKSDPITFTAEDIGWYAVHVNANDIVTTGAQPRWFLATILLPEESSDETLVRGIYDQISRACGQVGAQLVGGHTEITSRLDRTVLCGTMLGEVPKNQLITPRGARPGDHLLLTKGIPIEGTSILAADFTDRLEALPRDLVRRGRNFLHDPGISVVPEASAAVRAGGVTAMHDPTEGGLATGLWELSMASGVRLEVERSAIHIPPEAAAICDHLGVNPMEAIASGALLLSVQREARGQILDAIEAQGIQAFEIGTVAAGSGVILKSGDEHEVLEPPPRDAIAELFESR
jgi:hydrogenase expression/formation protein HypE